MSEARLVLELIGDARAPIELPRQGAMTLGSSATRADVALEGQGVAEVHCAIGRAKSGGWAIKDLGSDFGTLVNGERVTQRKLEPGDLVVLGSRRLRVVDPQAAATPMAVPTPTTVSVAPPSAPSPTSEATADLASRVDTRLPQVKGYRVESLLGRGGMGEVYLAVQESLGRPVALKVLAARLAADAEFVRKFQSEARAAAALNHPNVVTVHDVWEEGGRHFLAMEFMDKGNLEQRLQRDGRLSPKEALEILNDAAKALVYAELRGIVHRDIKPANLMQNSVGTTKLADLGLAMHLEADATESDNKKIFGTPHFISPEQARGEKVDIRSDLYSLGATLYRLIGGRTPFEGATTRDILRGHFLEEPKPLHELATGVPPALSNMVHRLLKKRPDERYASAGVLLQEVERLRSATLHGAPLASAVPAAPASSKLPLVLGAVAVVALGAAAFVFLRDGEPSTPRASGGNSTPGIPSNVRGGPPEDDEFSANGGVRPSPGTADDDTALKLRETEAENALLRVSRELDAVTLQAELRAMAQKFSGTTAAQRALEEAERVREEALRNAAVVGAYEQSIRDFVERLELAGKADGRPKPLAEALRAMLAQELPAALAGDANALARRRQIFGATLTDALARSREDAARADEYERSGRFDELLKLLAPWIVALDLPAMPPELGPDVLPDLGEVVALRASIQKRLDGQVAARDRFARALQDQDGLAIARALRGEGLEASLRALDSAGMERKLAALESSLATEPARLWAREWLAAVRASVPLLSTLATEFERGGWRRKAFFDPRSRTRAIRDAVGVNAEGLLVRVDATSEVVPWSSFGARATDLHQVFLQRLTREYTREELLGIDALLRMSAVLQAVDETSEMLQADTTSNLAEDEVRTITEAFDAARVWAQAAGTLRSFEREAEAASVWVDGLRAGTAASWSRAVAAHERLLSEFRDTLLVRLLSDGRP
ncbi:MAG: FHA domain-containing protein [Planctomycetes bacterium]|nr:FHA domain-containing protein [Planctomycetota bacterium]